MSSSSKPRVPAKRAVSRGRKIAASVWNLATATIDEFAKDRGDLVAAALAFYALLSIAPMIIIAVAIAGFILGEGAAHREVFGLLRTTMGRNAAEAVNGWVQQASDSGGVASVVGMTLTLLAASRFTAQLRSALNQVWNVDVEVADGFKATIRSLLMRRIYAFVSILAAGPLLLAVIASRAVIMGLGRAVLPEFVFAGVTQVLQLSLSLVLVALLTAVIFRVIPDTEVQWRAAAWGAVLTSILFNLGNLLVGLYLGRAAVAATYGVAGSLVVVLLWFYWSAHTFLLGAEFTQVYSTRAARSHEERPEQDG